MKGLAIALGVFVMLVIVYFWPVFPKDFADLAGEVEPQIRQSLLDFRARHPPRSVRVDGREWEYVVLGDGPETILFLHGMTGAYDIWWQQMVVLAERYRVIGVTYPPVDTLAEMSGGVLAVLDAEGVDRVQVVGTSLGGYLVQYLLTTHPERLERAVLANTFPPNALLRQKNEGLIKVLPFLPRWLVMKFLRKSIVEEVYPASGHSALVLAYMLEQVAGRMSKAQVVSRARVVIEPFPPPDPEALGIPVIIIEADNDPLVEEALREQLKATYPSAQVRTLRGVGHFPYLNEPEVYTALLIEFFGR